MKIPQPEHSLPVLQVEQLTGGYSKTRPVVHNIDFDIYPGEMIGLIGLNGAGKSTTIKHILGLMQPHHGKVYIRGQRRETDGQVDERLIAFVPESPELYEEMTVAEHLEFTARAYGVQEHHFHDRASHLFDLFHMRDKRDRLPAHLSKGMRQKVMLMCAFMAKPALYVIDEPFVGLDPLGIRSLLAFMVTAKEEGASILLSSHILSTIENDCDRFIVLHDGHVINKGTLEQLRVQASERGSLEQVFYTLVQERKS